MITNQSGIARGFFTVAEYEAVNAELFRQLGGGIDAAYFCPEHPEQATARRKPGTGMLEEAIATTASRLEESWFIGDKDTDILCGRTARLQDDPGPHWLRREHRDCGANFVARDIVEAARIILPETT